VFARQRQYDERNAPCPHITPQITRPPLPAAEHLLPATTAATASTRSPPSPSASFADPWVVRELHSGGIAHLPVRLRDGAGLVGPLAVPGVTSCLRNHQLEVGKQPTT